MSPIPKSPPTLRRREHSAHSRIVESNLKSSLTCPMTTYVLSYFYNNIFVAHCCGTSQFVDLVHARARRRFQRGLKRRPMGLIKKLRAAKKAAPPNEKPTVVKTHLRDMIIVPEMIGSVVGIYNGKVFNSVEIKPEMTGHYLAEFSISYKPVKHGRPGIGATHCECNYPILLICLLILARTASRFIPLK